MIGQYVFSRLSEMADELGLVNADSTVRIYPNYVTMTDKTFPLLSYECVNYQPDTGMDGPAGTAQIDVKVMAVSTSYDECNILATQVANALDATRGIWGDSDGLSVQGCFVEEVNEETFVDTDMATILYYLKELSFKVAYIVPV